VGPRRTCRRELGASGADLLERQIEVLGELGIRSVGRSARARNARGGIKHARAQRSAGAGK
jgi:hypothetical protein